MPDRGDPRRALAERLRGLRALSGLSLKDLERFTHASDSSLSRYLNGKAIPPWPVVVGLCRAVERDPRRMRRLWEEASRASVPSRATVPTPADAPADPAPWNDLPRDVASFTGRGAELHLLLAAAESDPPPIVVIDGMAGVGKSALAVHAAHLLGDRYPDGRFSVNLNGYTPGQAPEDPAAALRRLLLAAGLPESRVPDGIRERASLWRSTTAGRRAVLLLDNARSAEQVRDLLPGSSVLVIVTSRNRMAGLDDVYPLPLGELSESEGLSLLLRSIGSGRVADDPAAAADLLRLCGHLPLAIRIVAARLRRQPGRTMRDVARMLESRHVSAGSATDPLTAGDRSVAAAFAVSVGQLGSAERRVFRRLGLMPGDCFDVGLAAAVAGLSEPQTERILEALVDENLVEQASSARFRLHDLLRQFARRSVEQEESVAERVAAVSRVRDHLLCCVASATATLAPGGGGRTAASGMESTDRARAWLDREYATLRAAFIDAVADGAEDYVLALPRFLHDYQTANGRTAEWLEIVRPALDLAVRLGRTDAEAWLRLSHGTALGNMGERAASFQELTRAAELLRRAGDRSGEARALIYVGATLDQFGRYAEAREACRRAAELCRSAGDPVGAADAALRIGTGLHHQGRHAAARALAVDAHPVLASADPRYADAVVGTILGPVLLSLGRPGEAADAAARGLSASRELGMTNREAIFLGVLAVVERLAGRWDAAIDLHEQALELIARAGLCGWSASQRNAYGETLVAAGRPADAEVQHRRALDLAVSVGARYHEAAALLGLARVAGVPEAEGRRSEAERIFAEIGAVPTAFS